MLTSQWMGESRKLALTADCQAVSNEQESTCRPASSDALCPRQPVSPEGRKKTPQHPGSCQSSSSCLLGASCLIMLIKGQVQYCADDKFKSTPLPKTLISKTPDFSLGSLCPEHCVCLALRSQWDDSFALSLNFLDSLLLLLISMMVKRIKSFYSLLFFVLSIPTPFIPLVPPILGGSRVWAGWRNVRQDEVVLDHIVLTNSSLVL